MNAALGSRLFGFVGAIVEKLDVPVQESDGGFVFGAGLLIVVYVDELVILGNVNVIECFAE